MDKKFVQISTIKHEEPLLNGPLFTLFTSFTSLMSYETRTRIKRKAEEAEEKQTLLRIQSSPSLNQQAWKVSTDVWRSIAILLQAGEIVRVGQTCSCLYLFMYKHPLSWQTSAWTVSVNNMKRMTDVCYAEYIFPLRFLTLAITGDLEASFLKHVTLFHFPYLQSLTCSQIRRFSFFDQLRSMPRLKHLSLKDIWEEGEGDTATPRPLAFYFGTLDSLEIRWMKGFETRSTQDVEQGFKNLRSFRSDDMDWTFESQVLTSRSFTCKDSTPYLFPPLLTWKYRLSKTPNLKHITLFLGDDLDVMDALFEALKSRCVQVQSLELSGHLFSFQSYFDKMDYLCEAFLGWAVAHRPILSKFEVILQNPSFFGTFSRLKQLATLHPRMHIAVLNRSSKNVLKD